MRPYGTHFHSSASLLPSLRRRSLRCSMKAVDFGWIDGPRIVPAGHAALVTGSTLESLRVRGVDGLRIADASVMPEVVNATTHATCVMIGEKAALLVH